MKVIPAILLAMALVPDLLAQDPAARDISWYFAHCPFSMQAPVLPAFPARDFNITGYGAIADGHTLNTASFQKAIRACADAGGGRVIVPSGTWLTGPIQLLSHVDLYLAADAVVQFTSDHTQYPILSGHGGAAVMSPITAYDADDIAITGNGTFDGAGESWRPVKKEKMTSAQWSALLASGGVLSPDGKIWWPTREAMNGESELRRLRGKTDLKPEDFVSARDFLRPVLCSLVNCRHVLLRGILLRNSPKYVVDPNRCSDLTMDHVRIFNEWWAQNGDGIDISACHDVLLYQCDVNAGDDGICMKSSGASPNGGPALYNVVVAGCTVGRAHGGFVIGSNTDGGMHDIFVSDCSFTGTDVGLRFKSNMGRGGLADQVFIDNIHMRNIVHEAVLFDTYYENIEAGHTIDPNRPKPQDKTPQFTNFRISHVYCDGARTGISITGLPGMPISHISFDTLEITAGKGLVATQAKAIELRDVKWKVEDQPAIQADRTAEIEVH